MALIDLGGYRLEYEWVGPAGSRDSSLVFLHEGLGCVTMWRPFAASLAGRVGLPGFLYSRRGHGDSDPLTGPRSVRFLHDEALETLPAILARFGIGAPVLVGHSDGASIALIYAGSGSSQPRALMLEAPHVFVEAATRAGCAKAAEAYERSGLKGKLARYHGPNTDAMFRGWHEVWCSPAFEAWNIEEHLRRITCPVLVIQGEQDQYGTGEQLVRITKGASGQVTSLMLPNCGHTPHRDQPERVLAEMAGFIGGLSPRA